MSGCTPPPPRRCAYAAQELVAALATCYTLPVNIKDLADTTSAPAQEPVQQLAQARDAVLRTCDTLLCELVRVGALLAGHRS
jgi:hypothetical protein